MMAVMYRTLMASTGMQARTAFMRDTQQCAETVRCNKNAGAELKLLTVPVS